MATCRYYKQNLEEEPAFLGPIYSYITKKSIPAEGRAIFFNFLVVFGYFFRIFSPGGRPGDRLLWR